MSFAVVTSSHLVARDDAAIHYSNDVHPCLLWPQNSIYDSQLQTFYNLTTKPHQTSTSELIEVYLCNCERENGKILGKCWLQNKTVNFITLQKSRLVNIVGTSQKWFKWLWETLS